jgi:hypothetical protein
MGYPPRTGLATSLESDRNGTGSTPMSNDAPESRGRPFAPGSGRRRQIPAPVGIYPSWLRLILTVLVPVAFAVTIPSEALTGRLSLSTLTLATALTAVIFTISHATWRLGLRNYAGASA